MTRKTTIIEQLKEYFDAKGKVMTAEEYKSQDDTPIRFVLIKRHIGSWSRMLNMLGSDKGVETPVVEATEAPELRDEASTLVDGSPNEAREGIGLEPKEVKKK